MERKMEYPALCREVFKSHVDARLQTSDHDFDHALRVGRMASRLLEDNTRLAEMAFISGLCHNADRVVQSLRKLGWEDAPEGAVGELCHNWLEVISAEVTKEERHLIIDAVVRHTGANDERDHPLLVALRDADRLINVAADVVMRAGKQALAPVDYEHLLEDPCASYKKPGSVLWDLNYMSTKWDPEHPDHDPRYCLKLPRAVEIGRPRFLFLRNYVKTVLTNREEEGFVPYPVFS